MPTTLLHNKQKAQVPEKGARDPLGEGVVEETLEFTCTMEKVQGEKDTNNKTQEVLHREVYCAKGRELAQERDNTQPDA